MSQTERLIYDHISRTPIGMCPEALASELAVVIGPTIAPCPETREQQ